MTKAGSGHSAGMSLTYDGVVPYQGFGGVDGVLHLRLYRPASRWRRPVAIVGALADDPGISIVGVPESVRTAVESVAGARKRPFGRPRLIEHHPQSLHDVSKPSFVNVRLKLTRRRAEHAIVRAARRPIGRRRLQRLLRREVAVWPQRAYTAAAVGGAEGERLRREVAARSALNAKRLTESVIGPAGCPRPARLR